MAVEVRFREAAQADLLDLYACIAKEAGRARAGAYVDRIEAACNRVADVPERDIRRDDICPGLRVLGFERLFQVTAEGVEIGSILYGGRDLDALGLELED